MEILIIDIETTGFLQKGGKICEIGIVSLNLETGKKRILIDVTFNPMIPDEDLLETWIVKNNYMTIEEIKTGFNLEEFKPVIQKIIDKYQYGTTAYNNKFDFDFLESEGINIPVKLACPMKISTNICQIPNQNGYSGFKWPKAQEAYNHLFPENNYIELHRGADDAFHEADIVLKLYQMGKFSIHKNASAKGS